MRKIGWLEALVFACGCTSSIESGIIDEKRYEPEREYSKKEMAILVPPTFIYTKFIDDEDYVLVISGTDRNGKLTKREVYVTKEVYDSLKKGDAFDGLKIPHEDRDDDQRKIKLPERD